MSNVCAVILTTGIAWFVFGAVYLGNGLLAARLLGLRRADRPDPFSAFWIGWCLVAVLLQLMHFFVRIGPVAGLVTVLTALVGWFLARKELFRSGARPGTARPAYFVLLVLTFLLLAVRSAELPAIRDTALYHLDAIGWIKAYPTVPGLANLHPRLGFSSFTFLHTALFDAGPLDGIGYRLVSGLTIFVLFADFLASFFGLADGRRTPEALFPALCVGPVAMLMFGDFVASPAPDLTVLVFMLLAVTRLVRIALAPEPPTKTFIEFIVFTGVLPSIKLSGVGFTALGLFAVVLLAGHTRLKKLVGPLILIPALLIVPALIANLIVSGCPLFPSTVAASRADWQVPEAVARAEADDVVKFARAPGPGFRTHGSDPGWIVNWVARQNRETYTRVSVLGAILIGLAALGASAALAIFRRPRSASALRINVAALVIAGSLCFWFATAPDPRFASGLLIAFPVVGGLALAANFGNFFESAAFVKICRGLILLVLVAGIGLQYSRRRFDPEGVAQNGYAPLPKIEFVKTRVSGGLEVFVPADGELSWGGPRPCAPTPPSGLRLRSHDLSGGFRVDPE